MKNFNYIQFLFDYGTLIVLAGLCCFFSYVTVEEQSIANTTSAEKLVKKITKDREIILIYNFGTIEFLINHLNNDILENKVFVVASENIKQKIENKSKRLEIYVSSKPTDKMMMSMAKNFI